MGLQIVKMANDLHPEELADSRNPNQGAPIIRSDGVVLNGNGRVMAIREAIGKQNKSAKEYRKYLNEHKKELGFGDKAIPKDNPAILVREVVGELDEETLKEITTSTTGGSRLGASEQAKTDAEKISVEDLSKYAENENGDLTTPANRDFVGGVLNSITTKDDINAYTDSEGNANPDGIQRVKRAVFSSAYNDDHLISKMAESTDDNIRNISNGLMNAAPVIARINKLMEQGERHSYPLAQTIAEAVKRLGALRETGQTVENYLASQSMFSEYEETAETKEILKTLDEFKRSGKKVGRFLRRMAELVENQGDPNQISLMGENSQASLMEIIERSREDARDSDASGNLFAQDERGIYDTANNIVTLTENADESTFMHEMSHFYLNELGQVAEIAGEKSEAAKDLDTVNKWAEWREGQAEEYADTTAEKEFADLEKEILASEEKSDTA